MANCSAPYVDYVGETDIYCEEPEGHDGPHVAWEPIEWWDHG